MINQKVFEELLLKYLLEKRIFKGTTGNEYNVYDIIHNLSINSLKGLKIGKDKLIDSYSAASWKLSKAEEENYTKNKEESDFLSLVIDYRISLEQEKAKDAEKEKILKEIEALKEAIKTPEEKLQELRNKLSAM